MKKMLVFIGAALLSVVLAQSSNSIMDTVAANKQLSTLAAIIKTADMSDALSNEGPYTLLAPDDEAFKKLSPEDLDKLLKDPDAATDLVNTLILDGEFVAADVIKLDGQTVSNSNDTEFNVSVSDGHVMFDDATVTQADIKASNGVIHVIDSVLLPPPL